MGTSRPPVSKNSEALRETKLSATSKLLRRVIRHLTRRVALLAITLGCLASLIAIVVGPSTSVGQVMLVALGIFVSVVVLPEAPHRLWNVQPADLADTVPSDQLLDASRAIAEAIDIQSRRADMSVLPEKLIASVWDESLSSILEMIGDPSKVVKNLQYHATVSPAEMDSDWHGVDTTIRAERHLPRARDSYVWFSYCSSMSALSAEFDRHSDGCVARELIQLQENEDAEAWFNRVEAYRVYFDIDGNRVEESDVQRISTSEGYTVRVIFESGVLAERFVSTELKIEYSLPSDVNDLPVKFAAYSVVGTASVTIEVLDNRYEVDYDEYLSPANRNLSFNSDRTSRSTRCTIRTSGHTVLPIGAGAVFSWKRSRPLQE